MSSVQGSGSTIPPNAIDRVRRILDHIDGKPGLADIAATRRLKDQLEENVTTPDSAAALVNQLSGAQRDVLREVLPSLPTIKALFKDAFDRAPGLQDNVNSPDHGRDRNVRRSGSSKINDGRSVNVADIQGRLDESEPAASAPRPRRRRGAEVGDEPVPQGEPKPTVTKVADQSPPEAGPQAVDGVARKPRAPKPAAKATPVDGAANSDTAPAASAGADATAKADDAAGPAAAADGPKTTASGAPADVPADIHEALDQTLDFVKASLSPQSSKLYGEAMGIANKLQKDSEQFGSERAKQAQLKSLAKRTPEQEEELAKLNAKLRGKTDPAKLAKQFEKIAKEWENMPNHSGLLKAYYGLEKNRPSLEEGTKEGDMTLMILDELVGRDSKLPPDIKAKIAAFRNTDEGKRMLSLRPNMDIAKALFEGKLDTRNPMVQAVLEQVNGGGLVSEEQVAAVLALPPPPPEPVEPPGTGHPAVGGGAPPSKPPRGPGGRGPVDPGDPSNIGGPSRNAASSIDQDKWFNPLNRNWFGMSRVRHDQLKNDGHTELLQAIQEYNSKTQQMHMTSATRLNSMMSILNSGLPIESILLLFMGMMTENEEEKLRLKMAEIVVAEQFERTNRKLSADQSFARDLVRKYMTVDGIAPEQRENISKEQLEKMAGLVWSDLVTPQDAARENARGAAIKTLRADGVDKISSKLDSIKLQDRKLNTESLKEIGITPEALAAAGVHTEEDLAAFKREIADMAPEELEARLARKPADGEAPEIAARDNARATIISGLRADGMEKVPEKLARMNYSPFDSEALKKLGLTPEMLKTAGVRTDADLIEFKLKAKNVPEKDVQDMLAKKPVDREARFIDVTLNPMDFGFTTKPSQALVQELQVQMQNYKQIMETFTSVIRMLQDIVARITQNIR